jgi:hypothetical protein
MVPYLLVDQASVAEPHAGTTDLDLALSISLVSSGSYKNLPGLLTDAGFTPDPISGNGATRAAPLSIC